MTSRSSTEAKPPAPIVVKPGQRYEVRKGRGFSKGELALVGLTVTQARRLGLYVDKRRKSVHQENVEALRKYLEQIGWKK